MNRAIHDSSNDYHDYVIKDGKFIGKFEEMYRACADPWPETEGDLNTMPCSVRTAQLIAARKPARVLSVGSGKGLHLNWLAGACPKTAFAGCEVSQTAVQESLKRYPHIPVTRLDAKDFAGRRWDFDLILFREVIWYILPHWDGICRELQANYAGRQIITELSFYDRQEYGREYFDGPDEFVKKFPFEVIEILRHHTTGLQREGMVMVYGTIPAAK